MCEAEGGATAEVAVALGVETAGSWVAREAADDSLAILEERVANMSVVLEGKAGELEAAGATGAADETPSVPMENTSDWQ